MRVFFHGIALRQGRNGHCLFLGRHVQRMALFSVWIPVYCRVGRSLFSKPSCGLILDYVEGRGEEREERNGIG